MSIQILTDKQVNSLLMAPDCRTERGRRDKALLAVLAYGGLRIAEACSLRRDDVEKHGDFLRLTFTGKGNKTRTVTLPPEAGRYVSSWLRRHQFPYIFPGRISNTAQAVPLAVRTGRHIVTQQAYKAGLPSWVHPHSLRHTYATRLMRLSGDVQLVQRVLGHSNPKTTIDFYLAWNSDNADKAARFFE